MFFCLSVDKMAFVLSLLFLVSADETWLKDGETAIVDSESMFGTEIYYKFQVNNVTEDEIVISLTTYSDYSDPDMLVKVNKTPTFDDYDYESLSWGSGSIVISPLEIKANSTYYIMVLCYTICRYGITLSHTKEIVLLEGVPISNHLDTGRQAIYQFTAGKDKGDTLTITLSKTSGKADLYVVIGKDQEPTSDNSELVEVTWEGNIQYKTLQYTSNTLFRIAVMAEKDTDYTLLAQSLKSTATMIQAGTPISGEVSVGDFNYYYIKVLSPNDSIIISLTMLTGDGDIYVKAGGLPSLLTYNFSSVHNGNENLVITKVDRDKIGSPTGNYYIGIFGYMHSVYTLTVTTSNSSFVQVQPGVPQSGSVNQSMFSYFYLEAPQVNTNVTITLSAASGNPDLFVKRCKLNLSDCLFTENEIKNLTNIYSSRHSSGSDSVEIPHNESSCSSTRRPYCKYVIGVYGAASYSTYTLTAITNNTDEIILQDGKPLMVTLQEFSSKYFKFTVFNESVSQVDFMISPIYGDPDLYGSFNTLLDDFENVKDSVNTGVEIDQIKWVKGIDSDSLKGTYHLMVLGIEASSLSILAKTTVPGKNTTIQIYPGHPQKDTVYNYTDRDFRIYSFPVHYSDDNRQTITITLTAITGTFNLYAANKLSNLDWNSEIFYYNWKASNSNHSDPSYTITITPKDPWYLSDSTYLILVMAEKFLADKSATYTVSYTAGDGSLLLSEDTPFSGVVLMNDYSYFIFPVHFSHEDIVISLTTLSGDPDLFISVNSENTRPTSQKYDFKSTTFGNEKITLTWEEGLKEKCPNLPVDYKFGDAVHCYMYIAVFGFETTTFTIRIHPTKGLPSFLPSGQVTKGEMGNKEYEFYYSFIDTNKGLKLILQPDQGDSDLFLNIVDKETAGNDGSQWVRPNRETNDYSSQSTVMNEEIILTASELSQKCQSGTCLILISAYCVSSTCTFLVQVGDKSVVQSLVENQPTYGSSDKEMVYFSYYCNKDDSNFLVTVTTLGSCNPDLYISKGRNNFPNVTNFDWFSGSWGGDSILITKDDLYFEGKSMKGTYIIGIFDSWEPCTFNIIVNNNPKPIMKLISGVPQYSNQTSDNVNYFSFNNYINEDVIITLTPTYGSGLIYVIPYREWESDIYANLPGPDNYIWSSVKSPNQYVLNISFTDPSFCSYCQYVIAVKTDDKPLVYSINMKNLFDITVLQDGVPSRGESSNGRWTIFAFEVLKKIDIDISITTFTSHPTLFVSTSSDLQASNYNWTQYYLEGTQHLRISKNDENYIVGTYYIVVEAYDLCLFSIVSHTADSPIVLIDGWPLSYTLEKERKSKAHFKFTALTGHMVFCSVKSFGKYRPTVYAKFQLDFTRPQIPSADSNDVVFQPSDFIEFPSDSSPDNSQLYFNLPHTKGKAQLNIGLYSNETYTEDVLFQVHCSSSTQTTTLGLDWVYVELLDNNVLSKKYEISTPSKGTLSAYIVPCVGEFKLEISSNWTLVNNDNPDITTVNLVNGILMGSMNNANGNYYITVSNRKPTNKVQIYEIFSTFTPIGHIVPSQLKPGKNGLITWELEGDNEVEISWNPVEDDNGVANQSLIIYRVYFTRNKDINMISSCSIHFYSSRSQVRLLGTSETTSLKVKIKDKTGFVNVIAYLPRNHRSPIKQVVYDPTEIVSSNSLQDKRTYVVFWLLAALLIVSSLVAYYFYKRKRAVETKLTYEMSDVRNIASVSSPELVKRNDPYSQLSNP